MNKQELKKKYTEKDIGDVFIFVIVPLFIWSAILCFIITFEYNKYIGIPALVITVILTWFLLKRLKFII